MLINQVLLALRMRYHGICLLLWHPNLSPMRALHRSLVVLCICLYAFLPGHAQRTTMRDENIAKFKSMYMINFIKYTTWPDSVLQDTFHIGVMNAHDTLIAQKLEESAQTKKAYGLPIKVHHTEDLESLTHYNMIYLAEEHSDQAAAIREQIGAQPILFVTDHASNTEGNIDFSTSDENIKYTIVKHHFTNNGLKVNETLTNLAVKVTE
jgi:hypothetical protein